MPGYERTTTALAAKKAAGAVLGNPTNLALAGAKGRAASVAAADQFAQMLVPFSSAYAQREF